MTGAGVVVAVDVLVVTVLVVDVLVVTVLVVDVLVVTVLVVEVAVVVVDVLVVNVLDVEVLVVTVVVIPYFSKLYQSRLYGFFDHWSSWRLPQVSHPNCITWYPRKTPDPAILSKKLSIFDSHDLHSLLPGAAFVKEATSVSHSFLLYFCAIATVCSKHPLSALHPNSHDPSTSCPVHPDSLPVICRSKN